MGRVSPSQHPVSVSPLGRAGVLPGNVVVGYFQALGSGLVSVVMVEGTKEGNSCHPWDVRMLRAEIGSLSPEMSSVSEADAVGHWWDELLLTPAPCFSPKPFSPC